ncbi:YrrS family protein [Rummeliibacillus suwonensis]|uniref:YrrS family protein n=1 Tax=Rummeliibacillus suwonensis TaxID=1306154 RepID=UPI0011B82DB4|nr:YrrS family protein [Rummeliibacillus suwonensis]
MAELGRRYNPKEKKTKNTKNTGKKKLDKILNLLIGVVVVLILIVAAFIVIGGTDDPDTNNKKVAKTTQQDPEEKDENIVEKDPKEIEKEKAQQAEDAQEAEEQDQTQTDTNENSINTTEENMDDTTTETDTSSNDTTTTNDDYNYEDSQTASTEASSDPNVAKVITDSSWQPTKTSQKDSGSTHVSSYSEGSADWNEKITTIANTTGLDKKDMIIWYVKNGGSPDTSVGIVSSKDKKKSYRVSMKWIANEGWKPTKLEVLKTYKGAY